MSLTSSLFTGTSGLTNMGNAMQVIGDNIANVNTVGYKGGRYTFADLLSQNVATQSGSAQVGRGMAIGSVDQKFQQGSFESTGNTTDLSIGGDGFFVVRQDGTDRDFYTRAGNFNFDKDGFLSNPTGHILQGWKLNADTGDDEGSVTDIVLQSFTSPPKVTDQISAITNLDADAVSQSSVLTNSWDGTEEPPMGVTNYEYQTVIKVYDSLGSTHDLTIYYDKKEGADWEYIVTCNPAEDKRNLVQGTAGVGLLARGVVKYSDSSGTISDISMEEFTGRISSIDTNGSISPDKTHFTINNYDVFTQDYQDIGLEFDGANWGFSNSFGRLDPPYENATITGDASNIYMNFDNDAAGVVDLEINFDAPAQPFDSLSFDLVDPNLINVQGVFNTMYRGDTANDNTILTIKNPEVLTDDSEGNQIVWNASASTPFWSWGEVHSMSTFTGGVAATNTKFDITNKNALVDTGSNFQLDYDGAGGWTIGTDPGDYPTATITAASADSVTVSLTNSAGGTTDIVYNFTTTLVAAGTFQFGTMQENGPVGYEPDLIASTNFDGTTMKPTTIDSVNVTDRSALVNAGPYDLEFNEVGVPQWTFGGSNPFATGPYAGGATAVTGDVNGVTVTLDNGTDTTEIQYSFDAPIAGTGDFDFSTKAYTPDAYANAQITGDRDKVRIDMNNDGEDDISFDFTDPLSSGAGVDNSQITFDIEGTTAWTAQETNANGYYDFSADFLGAAGGATEMSIDYNIGAQDDGTGQFVNDSLSSTQYARSSSTVYQAANGYGAGDLQGVDVASDGVITGLYSNGQLIPLYRVALAKFLNNQGLYKEGGNLYRETRDSGMAITNKPGENGLGSISPNSLEMSNVDVADEFVKMITTQRGFQANSKIVTTVDGMLETVIQMKR